MSRQPLHVIWPSLLDGGHVIDAAWREAIAARQFVGTCTVAVDGGKECGQPLRPGPPYPLGRTRTGYTAVCSGCGHEYGAMGPSDAPAKTYPQALSTGGGSFPQVVPELVQAIVWIMRERLGEWRG